MKIAIAFTRALFITISVFFMTAYMVALPGATLFVNGTLGIALGLGFGMVLVGFDIWFRRYNLRSFNIAVIGMIFGYLMGQALVWIFEAMVNASSASSLLNPAVKDITEISLLIFGIYLGTIMTLRAADEIHINIPFIRLSTTAQKKRDILLDISALSDARLIDLASSGLLDHHLIVPRFILKDLYAQIESADETIHTKGRRMLEVLKKLEAIPSLELRYNDTDFSDVKDSFNKMIRLSRLLDTNILASDVSRVQMASVEGVRIINILSLSNALKPLMQTGEMIKIKIQRYGKEPRQGVGYLDDGTMVVVNGGGHFIGQTIGARVLSVKHTTSGRMIFCNAPDEKDHLHDDSEEREQHYQDYELEPQ